MREMENMRGEIGEVIEQIHTGMFLPSHKDGVLPALRGMFRIDVREINDEVIVIADLPGIEREKVSLRLVNPRVLEISCQMESECEDSTKRYYVRERRYGNTERIVNLPADVTVDGAAATFKNGVLDIRMKKTHMQSQVIEIME
jgi:HSP20 family protein